MGDVDTHGADVGTRQQEWTILRCSACGAVTPDGVSWEDWCPAPENDKTIPEHGPLERVQVVPLHLLREAQEALKATEEYAKEGWAWLDDALDALGAETVFGIEAAKEARERLEAALREIAADTEDQWSREAAEELERVLGIARAALPEGEEQT
jgi:hypothetical protein